MTVGVAVFDGVSEGVGVGVLVAVDETIGKVIVGVGVLDAVIDGVGVLDAVIDGVGLGVIEISVADGVNGKFTVSDKSKIPRVAEYKVFS